MILRTCLAETDIWPVFFFQYLGRSNLGSRFGVITLPLENILQQVEYNINSFRPSNRKTLIALGHLSSPRSRRKGSMWNVNYYKEIIIIIISSCEFFTPALAKVFFHWRFSDSKSPQVFWTFLCNLADLINAVVLMVSIRLLISNTSSLSSRPFGTVPSAPITIGITVILMFHSFFSSLARFKYLLEHFLLFSLCGPQEWQNSRKGKFSFYLLINAGFGHLPGIWWSVCI